MSGFVGAVEWVGALVFDGFVVFVVGVLVFFVGVLVVFDPFCDLVAGVVAVVPFGEFVYDSVCGSLAEFGGFF